LKKVLNLGIALVLVLGLTLAFVSQPVKAATTTETTTTWYWVDEKITGTEFNVDLTLTPAPAWLQLNSTGLTISAPAKICVPFRYGQFNWVGEIHQLVDGKWVKLNTTNQWDASEEGTYEACAFAPSAGTYALFALYPGDATTELSDAECAALFATPTYDSETGRLTELMTLQPQDVKVTASVVLSYTIGMFNPLMSSGMTDRYIYWNITPTGEWTKLAVELSAAGCTSKMYVFMK